MVERINIDDLEPRPERVKKLHPTLKKCACGFIGSKHKLYKHFDETRFEGKEPVKNWFDKHGEVPCNVDDPDVEEWGNVNWMAGQHPNYND
jgi:hypothetical protein